MENKFKGHEIAKSKLWILNRQVLLAFKTAANFLYRRVDVMEYKSYVVS